MGDWDALLTHLGPVAEPVRPFLFARGTKRCEEHVLQVQV